MRKSRLKGGARGRRPLVIVLTLVFGCAVAVTTRAQTSASAVTSACHVSPIVSNLDKSAHFYHDLLGLDLVPSAAPGPLPWDTDPGHLDLHGLPQARLRFVGARMPGVFCGVELVEFSNAGQRPLQRRLQDPGSVMLILLVRDLNAIFSRLKAEETPVVTKGGEPILVASAKIPAVIVTDPDGHLIELAQLDPPPPTTALATSNVIGIRLRVSVADMENARRFYRETLGLNAELGDFTKEKTVMAMMGLPDAGEFRVATATMPGSPLLLELIEFKGVGDGRVQSSRVQDPGSYRLQLNVRDIDQTIAALAKAGSRVISTGGVPVRMTFGANPWRLAVAPDPNNLFLIIQQRLAP